MSINRKQMILEEMLQHAAFDGWNDAAINTAAKHLWNEEKYAKIAFPGGIIEVSDYYTAQCDAEMNARLEELNLKEMRIRERISTAVITRLEIYDKHKPAIHTIVARRLLPDSLWNSITAVGGTVDDMWFAAGDTSTDYNFYSKRLILSGVYTSTLLFWLQDDSEDFTDTREFIDRRIENVMKFEKLKGKALDIFSNLIPHK